MNLSRIGRLAALAAVLALPAAPAQADTNDVAYEEMRACAQLGAKPPQSSAGRQQARGGNSQGDGQVSAGLREPALLLLGEAQVVPHAAQATVECHLLGPSGDEALLQRKSFVERLFCGGHFAGLTQLGHAEVVPGHRQIAAISGVGLVIHNGWARVRSLRVIPLGGPN